MKFRYGSNQATSSRVVVVSREVSFVLATKQAKHMSAQAASSCGVKFANPKSINKKIEMIGLE